MSVKRPHKDNSTSVCVCVCLKISCMMNVQQLETCLSFVPAFRQTSCWTVEKITCVSQILSSLLKCESILSVHGTESECFPVYLRSLKCWAVLVSFMCGREGCLVLSGCTLTVSCRVLTLLYSTLKAMTSSFFKSMKAFTITAMKTFIWCEVLNLFFDVQHVGTGRSWRLVMKTHWCLPSWQPIMEKARMRRSLWCVSHQRQTTMAWSADVR